MCISNRRKGCISLPSPAFSLLAKDAKASAALLLEHPEIGTNRVPNKNNVLLMTHHNYSPQEGTAMVESERTEEGTLPLLQTKMECTSPRNADHNHHREHTPKKLLPGLTAKKFVRHYAKHNYHDHSLDEPADWEERQLCLKDGVEESVQPGNNLRGGVPVPFPLKLHYLLDRIEEDGFAHIISWQPHGRSFVVHDQKSFVADIMPKYFRQSKITSFQRQLNLYGFSRITRGMDRGGYYHELFLKNKRFLTHRMNRTKVKGTKIKAVSCPEQEPNFYTMPPVGQTQPGLPCQEDPSKSVPPVVSSEDLLKSTQDDRSDIVLTFEGKHFHYLDNQSPPCADAVIDQDPPLDLDQEVLAVISACDESPKAVEYLSSEEDAHPGGAFSALQGGGVGSNVLIDEEMFDPILDLQLGMDEQSLDCIHSDAHLGDLLEQMVG